MKVWNHHRSSNLYGKSCWLVSFAIFGLAVLALFGFASNAARTRSSADKTDWRNANNSHPAERPALADGLVMPGSLRRNPIFPVTQTNTFVVNSPSEAPVDRASAR